MKNYAQIATDNFLEGYNCSQAVLLAFADELGLDRQTAAMLASSFGGGMGRLREVCGTVSGMFMVAGIIYGYSEPKNVAAKTELYRKIQELASEFKAENGSIICRELLGLDKEVKCGYVPEARSTEYYKKRPCKELVGQAAGILADYIKKNPPENYSFDV